jgi:RNA polymerase sigma-70 factor (ECF subfamily)
MAGDPVEDLLDQLARGDAAAAERLFAAYASYLRVLVRRQFPDQLRAKFDSADVVQSVWVQVVRKLGQSSWDVADEARLRGLLATIARRRLLSRARRHAGDPGSDPTADPDTIPEDRTPRASEEAQANDLWARMLELCPADHREVLLLRRDGLRLTEIAERTGLHEGSVRRILRRLARELALKTQPIAPDLADAEAGG